MTAHGERSTSAAIGRRHDVLRSRTIMIEKTEINNRGRGGMIHVRILAEAADQGHGMQIEASTAGQTEICNLQMICGAMMIEIEEWRATLEIITNRETVILVVMEERAKNGSH